MTNDEAMALSCASQIQQYCQETECINCIFCNKYRGCLVGLSYPEAWHLTLVKNDEVSSK